MNDPVARCSVCVLPRSEKIQFDENNVCQMCQVAEKLQVPEQNRRYDEKELAAQIDLLKERGRARPYDAVVGVSGGRDSSYVLHQLVRRHGVRCLAAYYRTPFTPDEIDDNVRRMTADMGVPLVEMDISQDYHRRFATKMVRLWLRRPAPIIANMACAPCKQVNNHIYKIAREQDVPSIVYGINKYEAFQLIPGSASKDSAESARGLVVSRIGQFKIMLSLIRTGLQTLYTYPELLTDLPAGVRAVMYISNRTPFLRLRYRNIMSLDYFHYAPYDEADRDRALDEMGWKLPPGCNTNWRADCAFIEIKNYMYKQMTGVTYYDSFFANMVRHGDLSREKALERLAVEGQISPLRIEQSCDVMGISADLFPLSEG